jgi:glycosyltransferase involved in cell wall biosynthesis
MRSKISVIIPFLNEEANIPFLVKTLSEFLSTEKRFNTEIIFVNDGSTDNSSTLLIKQEHKNYSYKIITLSKNFGSHAAIRAGILNSTGDYVTFMYADLQDPIDLISRMYESIISSNKDIIWATRNTTKSGFVESFFSKTYSYLMKRYVSKDYPEKGFDVLMFSKKISLILNKNIESNSSIFLQILTLGFHQGYIIYDKKPRINGVSKWTLSKKIKLFVDSFVAFSFLPIRVVSIVGILFFFGGVIWSSYLVFRKLTLDDLESGWPALMAVLSIGFGVTNISLGVIAEYLWRTLDSARKRPVFIIDEIIEIKKDE